MSAPPRRAAHLPRVVRDVLSTCLDLTPDAVDTLQVLVRISRSGWSHHIPAGRYFLFRDGEPLVTVKRIPHDRIGDRARLLGLHEELARATHFRVPRRLAAVEDEHALYLVEEMVPAPNLAASLAANRIDVDDAGAALAHVLDGLWALRRPLDAAVLERNCAALRGAAEAVLGDQPARTLVEGVLTALVERHRAELATVATTHDVHLANVLRDADGQLWLTDFDLAGDTALFGLDYYRAWFLSAPLQRPAAPPAWISPAAMALYELIYPIFEYSVQAPTMPPPERGALRRYAEDLEVRLALPRYHAAATFQPHPVAKEPPQAQIFFAAEAFSEDDSLRFPIDQRSGRLHADVALPHPAPRWLRLDPVDAAHGLLILHQFSVHAGARTVDVAAALAAGADGVRPVDLRPLPHIQGGYWVATGDPQIVVDLETLGATPATRVAVDLELVREWRRRPAVEPALLLAHLHERVGALDAALTARDATLADRDATLAARDAALAAGENALADRDAALAAGEKALADRDAGAASQLAAARREARALRHAAAQPAAAASPQPPAPRRWPRTPRDAATLALAVARHAAARAAARVRRSSAPSAGPAAPRGPSAAPALHYVLAPAGRWPAPLVSIVLPLDDSAAPDAGAVQAWLAAQTCQACELIAWSPRAGRAWPIDTRDAAWLAPDWPALAATLAGRHVAFATPALLAQPAVHLEVALLALESEALDLVWVGPSHATPALDARADGTAAVARVESLDARAALEPTTGLARRGAATAAIGKHIVHPTASPAPAVAPAAAPLPADLQWIAPYLIAGSPGTAAAAPVEHPLRLVDQALTLPQLPSPLPTVLTVFPFLAVGGAERVALDVMQQLADQVRWVVVALEPADERLGTTADRFRDLTPYVYTAPDFLAHPLLYSLLVHLIGRFAPATLYVANGCGWIYDALPTLKAQFPRLRTANQVYDQRHGWIERYDALLVAALDAHIGCNARICAAYRERGAPPERVHEVPHGIDITDFDPARFDAAARAALRARFGLATDRRTVAFLSRLHPQKRPMDFVELARQLRGDASLQFLMVGDGPLRGEVEAAIAASGLTNLVLHRFHHPSRELFAVADAVVLPSAYEGMPLVVLEAQAMGVPVVTTDVGNARDMLAHGGGLVVDAIGDVGALRRALRAVLDSPPDPAAMRAAVAARWGAPVVAEQYRRVLLGEDDAGT